MINKVVGASVFIGAVTVVQTGVVNVSCAVVLTSDAMHDAVKGIVVEGIGATQVCIVVAKDVADDDNAVKGIEVDKEVAVAELVTVINVAVEDLVVLITAVVFVAIAEIVAVIEVAVVGFEALIVVAVVDVTGGAVAKAVVVVVSIAPLLADIWLLLVLILNVVICKSVKITSKFWRFQRL